MVVLQHDAVHQTLWGPAITTGRSKALDILVYRQIVVLTALAALCCLHYDKPTAVRLGVSGGVMLLYFRNTFLFSRLLLLITCAVLYGDLILPAKQFMRTLDRPTIPLVQLALNCFLLLNNMRILYAVAVAGVFKSQPNGARQMHQRRPARYHKTVKAE